MSMKQDRGDIDSTDENSSNVVVSTTRGKDSTKSVDSKNSTFSPENEELIRLREDAEILKLLIAEVEEKRVSAVRELEGYKNRNEILPKTPTVPNAHVETEKRVKEMLTEFSNSIFLPLCEKVRNKCNEHEKLYSKKMIEVEAKIEKVATFVSKMKKFERKDHQKRESVENTLEVPIEKVEIKEESLQGNKNEAQIAETGIVQEITSHVEELKEKVKEPNIELPVESRKQEQTEPEVQSTHESTSVEEIEENEKKPSEESNKEKKEEATKIEQKKDSDNFEPVVEITKETTKKKSKRKNEKKLKATENIESSVAQPDLPSSFSSFFGKPKFDLPKPDFSQASIATPISSTQLNSRFSRGREAFGDIFSMPISEMRKTMEGPKKETKKKKKVHRKSKRNFMLENRRKAVKMNSLSVPKENIERSKSCDSIEDQLENSRVASVNKLRGKSSDNIENEMRKKKVVEEEEGDTKPSKKEKRKIFTRPQFKKRMSVSNLGMFRERQKGVVYDNDIKEILSYSKVDQMTLDLVKQILLFFRHRKSELKNWNAMKILLRNHKKKKTFVSFKPKRSTTVLKSTRTLISSKSRNMITKKSKIAAVLFDYVKVQVNRIDELKENWKKK